MEVNKGEAERCRDMGAVALRSKQYERAVKLFEKSLRLYPLPGVEVLLEQSKRKLNEQGDNGGSSSTGRPSSSSAQPQPPQRSESNVSTGADGRTYTEEQVKIVKQILRAKEGGRGAHYRVLSITENASENDIKKAYRKLALKLHPDKNSAPHADEAFKAVGLAYATLSDTQKRTIYDRYGEEDPDNRGGGPGGMRHGGGFHGGGQEVSPEEIFNMFFGGGFPAGGMRGGGPGFHVYTSGFGPGMHFAGARPRRRAAAGGARQEEEPQAGAATMWMQLIPFLVIMLLSFFNMSGDHGNQYTQNRYFSLTRTEPFVNQLHTKLTPVKDIPYFVTDKFLRTYYRDRYQLGQVERMVQTQYRQYLDVECKKQRDFQQQLKTKASKQQTLEEKDRMLKQADEFVLSRCVEMNDLFPPQGRN